MQLSLLRHAKTKPGSASLADADRPLEAAGRRALQLMEKILVEDPPDLVLCSAALRTRETWEQVEPALTAARADGKPAVLIEEELYLAGADRLLARLRQIADQTGSVLVVGHNPGIHDLALGLLAPGERASLATGFPTAGLARLSIDQWPDLRPGRSRLLRWATPKSLEESSVP